MVRVNENTDAIIMDAAQRIVCGLWKPFLRGSISDSRIADGGFSNKFSAGLL